MPSLMISIRAGRYLNLDYDISCHKNIAILLNIAISLNRPTLPLLIQI